LKRVDTADRVVTLQRSSCTREGLKRFKVVVVGVGRMLVPAVPVRG